jgi:DNA-binding transcriptional LysR family regulator
VAASPAGEPLAAHALRNALEADRVVADIEALKGLRRGLIRVCCSAGFAIEFLPKAMAQFRGQHPGMQFHLRVAAPAAVTQAVLNIEAGIGLTYSRTAERDIELQTLAGRTLPEGVRGFTLHEGVWVCDYASALPLAQVLRQWLIALAVARAAGEVSVGCPTWKAAARRPSSSWG